MYHKVVLVFNFEKHVICFITIRTIYNNVTSIHETIKEEEITQSKPLYNAQVVIMMTRYYFRQMLKI